MQTLVGLCLAIGIISLTATVYWLLRDWQHEVRRARIAATMAQKYQTSVEPMGKHRLAEDDDTMPIVVQPPAEFFDDNPTMPIPLVHVSQGGMMSEAAEPEENNDQAIGLVRWYAVVDLPTVVLPVVPHQHMENE
jgi:hypothetical protein